jgi:hypothetical protein
MIHVIERNEQFGIQILRTSLVQEAATFIIEGGYPEAYDAAQEMEAAYYEDLTADVYVVIDTRGEGYDYEVMSV